MPIIIHSAYSEKFSVLLLGILVLVAIVGVFSVDMYNYLPANSIFEIIVFIFAIVSIFPIMRNSLFFVFLSLTYLLLSFFVMRNTSPAAFNDYFIAYKSFYYVIILSFFIGKNLFNTRYLKFTFCFLLFLFLVKYGYSRFLNITERPGIYTENNFELIFILLFYYAIVDDLNENKLKFFFIVSLIVTLSGSRSALLALIVVYCFVFLSELNLKTIMYVVCFILLLFLTVFIIAQRSVGGVEDIDRFLFLTVFMDEIRNWGISEFIFGSQALTPLSSKSCSILSFYEDLFSYSRDGNCYSVILHSYLLRLVFDHGIFGVFFIFSFIAYGLKMAGYKSKEICCVMGVVISTGLSVSSVNSIYVAMALLIMFSYNKNYRFDL